MSGASVVVVGLGVMGAAALGELARRGVKVVGLEQYWPGHPFGSSHGDSRIIRQAYYEHPDYVPLVQEAWRGWERLEDATGWPLVTRTGGLMLGRPGSALVEGARRSAAAHGLAHTVLDAAGVTRHAPAFAPDPEDVAVMEPEAGFLAAELAVQALLGDASRHGAQIVLGQQVAAVAADGAGVRVDTAAGPVTADGVVVAAGPYTRALLPELTVPLAVERQVAVWLEARDPAWFSPARFPVFMREEPGERGGATFYGFPSQDGRTVKVARHHGGAVVDPVRVDRQVHADDLEPVRRFVVRTLPGLDPNPVRSVVCLYTNTPDRHFVVGPLGPSTPQIVLAAGFSGHGFKFAPAIGRLVADWLLEHRPGPALFQPDRWA